MLLVFINLKNNGMRNFDPIILNGNDNPSTSNDGFGGADATKSTSRSNQNSIATRKTSPITIIEANKSTSRSNIKS